MGLNLYLPNVSKDKATAKDYIIQVLSRDWPLSAKKIYNQIKKQFGFTCTYQAVFKALKELEQMEVILKDNSEYKINMKWLKHIHSFTEITETNYYTKNRLSLVDGIKESKKEGDISILTFETIFDVEKYLYYLQKDYILGSGKPLIICSHHNHEWRPIYYMRAEYNWINKLNSLGHKSYILCANGSVIDKFCARFYKNIGCNIKLNVNCASTCELLVIGDLIVEIYLPYEIVSNLNNLFLKINNLSRIKPELLISKVFEMKSDIQVIIKKDKSIAEQIRKQTLKYF